jgi:hypothetical protein
MLHNDDVESIFSSLPASTRRRIDRAFDTIAQLGQQNAPSSTVINQLSGEHLSEVPAGGYILEDTPQSGFHTTTNLNEESSASLPETLYIPLSEIPTALEILDLQTDDPEILSVFQKAASDWGTKDDDRKLVSKDDFRSVCAVLLEGEEAVGETDLIFESDEYREDHTSEDDDDDDEYIDQQSTKTQRKPGRVVNHASSKSSNQNSVSPSRPEQINECRRTFSWFFPSISNSDLDGQKLTIEAVARVAEDLKQPIKVEHVSF